MYTAMIYEVVAENEDKCLAVKDIFDTHSYLWTTDMPVFFAEFCKEAEYKSPAGQTMINLKVFEEAIFKYEAVRESIQQLQSPMDVGWLRINTQAIKSQLTTWAAKWVEMFTAHLRVTVLERLTNLNEFIAGVSGGLDRPLEEGAAVKELLEIMEHIRDVRQAADVTQEMFEPLQNMINILKAHGTDITSLPKVGDRPLQDFLDDAPMVWENVVKKTDRKKEDILPMQDIEKELLKTKLEQFFLSIREFRNNFRQNAPFTFTGSPIEAYKMMDSHAQELRNKELEAKQLNELEELFELSVSKYQEASETRVELKLLKNVWDLKALINGTFSSWNPILWSDIKTDDLEDISKNLLKILRKMGGDFPVVKGWVVYRSIEDTIKVMNNILPLISSLHADSMRDRHWKSVAKICDVKTVDPHDPKFCFEDLVRLKINEHGEDLEEVVELSMKELKIEKKLSEIEKIWRALEMNFSPHNDR